MIRIYCSKADATLQETETLTAGMVNTPVVQFTFSTDWAGLGKSAIVRAGTVIKEVVVTNNQIVVPSECLAKAGVNLIIGVWGGNFTTELPTVWCACGEIQDATNPNSALNHEEGTASNVAQMLAAAERAEAALDQIENANWDDVAQKVGAEKVNKPTSSPNGVAGQILKTNGDGSTQWINPVLPTDEQVDVSVSNWLDDHPEATTSVVDHSISRSKITEDLYSELSGAVPVDKYKTSNNTDYEAITEAIANNPHKTLKFENREYIVDHTIFIPGFTSEDWIQWVLLLGNGATIKAATNFDGDYLFQFGQVGELAVPYIYYQALKKGLSDLTLDCSGVCSGIYIVNAPGIILNNVSVRDATYYGVNITKALITSMDAYISNVSVTGVATQTIDSTGFYINSHDNSFYDIRTESFKTGIDVSGGGNTFFSAHPFWSAARHDVKHSIFANTVGFKVSGSNNSFFHAYADDFATGMIVTGSKNIVYDYWFFSYVNLTNWNSTEWGEPPTLIALKVANTNVIDGVRADWQSDMTGMILDPSSVDVISPQTSPKIRNVKYSRSNIPSAINKYGFDAAFNTAINPDSKDFSILNYAGTIQANTEIPLFAVQANIVTTVDFELHFSGKYYKCRYRNSQTSRPFLVEPINTGEIDAELVVSSATWNGINVNVVSLIPVTSTDRVDIFTNCRYLFPFVGYPDISTPLEKTKIWGTKIGKYTGATAITGWRLNGVLYGKGFHDLVRTLVAINYSGMDVAQDTEVHVCTWPADFPRDYLYGFVVYDGIQYFVSCRYRQNAEDRTIYDLVFPAPVAFESEKAIQFIIV